jgi:hypothetical protein
MKAEGEEGYRQKKAKKPWASSNKFLYVFLPSSYLTPPQPSQHLSFVAAPCKAFLNDSSLHEMYVSMDDTSQSAWMNKSSCSRGCKRRAIFPRTIHTHAYPLLYCPANKPVLLSPENGKDMVEDNWTVARLIRNTELTLMPQTRCRTDAVD